MESHILTFRDKGAMNGKHSTSSSNANLGRSAEHWRRLALLRSGDVDPYPGPPQARSWKRRKFLSADITVGTAKDRRGPRRFPCCDLCKLLLAHGLQIVVEAAATYLAWIFGPDEPFLGVAKTLVSVLR